MRGVQCRRAAKTVRSSPEDWNLARAILIKGCWDATLRGRLEGCIAVSMLRYSIVLVPKLKETRKR